MRRLVGRVLVGYAIGVSVGLVSYYLARHLGAGRHVASGIGGGVAAFVTSLTARWLFPGGERRG